MSRYQKGKTNLDFTEARDSEWQWHQLEHMHLAPDRCQHLTTQFFYRPDALPAAQPTASKHLRHLQLIITASIISVGGQKQQDDCTNWHFINNLPDYVVHTEYNNDNHLTAVCPGQPG